MRYLNLFGSFNHLPKHCYSKFSFQAIVQNPVDVMCNCYGSHVLRSLLCICKGVPLDSEFHAAKSSSVLARRLNLKADGELKNHTQNVHQGFPDVLEFLVSEMVKCSTPNIATLQVDQYGSLVLQAGSNSQK